MTQVSLAEIPQTLGPVFMAGDPAADGKAQERSNVEQIGRMVSAISQGRWDEVREQLAPDVVYEMAAPKRFPWRRTASGAKTVTRASRASRGSREGPRAATGPTRRCRCARP